MKYIISFFILIGISLSVNSQSLFTLKYGVAFPMGKTRSDLISKTSWRNYGFEGRYFMTGNVAVGGSFDWQVFYEETPAQVYNDGTLNVHGKTYRYINAYPILVTGHYYLKDYFSPGPYFGLGVGPAKIDQRTEMGLFSATDNYWHFGLAPEIGFHYPYSPSFGLELKVRYFYALKTSSADSYSWLGLGIGLNFF